MSLINLSLRGEYVQLLSIEEPDFKHFFECLSNGEIYYRQIWSKGMIPSWISVDNAEHTISSLIRSGWYMSISMYDRQDIPDDATIREHEIFGSEAEVPTVYYTSTSPIGLIVIEFRTTEAGIIHEIHANGESIPGPKQSIRQAIDFQNRLLKCGYTVTIQRPKI